MKIKQKLKTPNFWLTILGLIMLLLQAFNVRMDLPAINEVLSALAAGIICFCCLFTKDDKTGKDNIDDNIDKPNNQNYPDAHA